jgi:hypothetical protein
MSMIWEFREHEAFHRAALHMAIAGGLAGLGAHVAGLAVPSFGPVTGAFALAAVATATSYGVLAPAERGRLAMLARLLVAGVFACAALAGLGAIDPWLGRIGFAALLAAIWARGLDRRRFVLALAGGVVALMLAAMVLQRFATAALLAPAPGWAVAWLAGTGFAGVAVLGLVPRHLHVTRDRVHEAWDACRGALSGEIQDLLGRAMGVWASIERHHGPGDDTRRAVEAALLRLFQVAAQWQGIENGSRGDRADELVVRLDTMDAKIAATEDAVARAQYEQARAALAEQLRYLREIGTSRDRVLARLHHYVAAIERLRFASVNNRSADASRSSSELQPLVDELESLGRDLDVSSEAWNELSATAG